MILFFFFNRINLTISKQTKEKEHTIQTKTTAVENWGSKNVPLFVFIYISIQHYCPGKGIASVSTAKKKSALMFTCSLEPLLI